MRNLVYILVALLLVGCSLDDAAWQEDVRLGAKTKSIECAAEWGAYSVEVVSNVPFTADVVEGEDWLVISPGAKSHAEYAPGKMFLHLAVHPNESEPRQGKIYLEHGTRRDSVMVIQAGR